MYKIICNRYFSIVKKGLDDQNVDFLAMRKRYLILVWVLLVSQFIFTFAVGISVKKMLVLLKKLGLSCRFFQYSNQIAEL